MRESSVTRPPARRRGRTALQRLGSSGTPRGAQTPTRRSHSCAPFFVRPFSRRSQSAAPPTTHTRRRRTSPSTPQQRTRHSSRRRLRCGFRYPARAPPNGFAWRAVVQSSGRSMAQGLSRTWPAHHAVLLPARRGGKMTNPTSAQGLVVAADESGACRIAGASSGRDDAEKQCSRDLFAGARRGSRSPTPRSHPCAPFFAVTCSRRSQSNAPATRHARGQVVLKQDGGDRRRARTRARHSNPLLLEGVRPLPGRPTTRASAASIAVTTWPHPEREALKRAALSGSTSRFRTLATCGCFSRNWRRGMSVAMRAASVVFKWKSS